MSSMSTAEPESDEQAGPAAMQRLRARSRAVGVMVMALFASLWAVGGALLSGGGLVAAACIVAAAVALALGLRLLRDNPASSAPLPPRWRSAAAAAGACSCGRAWPKAWASTWW
jgi:hypothetical protein